MRLFVLMRRALPSLILLAICANVAIAQGQTWMTEPATPLQKLPGAEDQVTEPISTPKVPTPAENNDNPSTDQTTAPQPSTAEPKSETSDTQTQGDATLELARKAQNPISSMISLPLQYNANFGVGPNDATTQFFNIQPVYPVAKKNWTLVNRAIVPVAYVPNASRPTTAISGAELGLGDINYQLFFVPNSDSDFTWGVGPTVTFPTAFDNTLGTGKWLAGVNAVGLKMKGPWVAGALVSQQWSVAGDSARPDVSAMTVQPFLNYNMKKGWYLTTSPIVTANWEAPSNEQWTVPVGGGFGRIFAIGEQKVNVSLAGFKNVVTPTNGPDWSLRFQFTYLFPGS